MIRALRGDNIEEPLQKEKAESRIARVVKVGAESYKLEVSGWTMDISENETMLWIIADEINAEVDKRCREAERKGIDEFVKQFNREVS